MPIDKLIPRYLNKDDDYLLVKTVEMVDALNIQTADDEGGNAGVVKNALGNILVSDNTSGDALASGTNTVIGTASSKQTGQIFYFVYNSNNQHSIYEYTSRRNTVKLVYRDPVLNFTATGFVKADCLVKENGDTLLYFTDGITDPKKINATKALANTAGVSGYPYRAAGATGYTDAEKLLSITTIKAPPLEPPDTTLIYDSNINKTNISKKSFQFAYQYIYEDGEISAISPYSSITTSEYNFLEGTFSQNSSDFFNAISISIKYSKGDVSKIRILYRYGDLENFSVFKEVNNVISGTTTSVVFTNTSIGKKISDLEQNKLYDSVPLSAISQVISGNRLAYANYKEFYDNTSISGSVDFEYAKDVSEIRTITTTPALSSVIGTTVTASTSVNDLKFTLNLSQLPITSQFPVYIKLKFYVKTNINLQDPGGATFSAAGISGWSAINLGECTLSVEKNIYVSGWNNISSLASSIMSQVSGNYDMSISGLEQSVLPTGFVNSLYNIPDGTIRFQGTSSMSLSMFSINTTTKDITVLITPLSQGLNIQANKFKVDGIGTITDQPPIAWKGVTTSGVFNQSWTNFRLYGLDESVIYTSNSFKTFKSGQHHKFGIVYYDQYNRSSAVNEIGESYCLTEGERSDTGNGVSRAVIRVNSRPPSWAKKWQVVYSPYSTYSFAYRYSIAEAFIDSSSTVGSGSTGKKLYLSMRHLEGKPYSYVDSKGAIFDYTPKKGDKARIISYSSYAQGSGTVVYPSLYEFDVIGYEYYDTQNTPIGNSVSDDRRTGAFLIVTDPGYLGFTAQNIISGNGNLWDRDVVIEVFSPVIEQDQPVYYEIGVYGNVSSGISFGGLYHDNSTRIRSTQSVQISGTLFNNIFTTSSSTTYSFFPGDAITISTGGIITYAFNVLSSNIDSSGRVILTLTEPSSKYGLLPSVNYPSVINHYFEYDTFATYNGDCYYRPRQIKMNPLVGVPSIPFPTDTSGVRYVPYNVEDLSISDFYDSKFIGKGRPNAISQNAKQIERGSSITYSEPYSLDTSVLKLSSFNGGQGNFVDLPNAYGAINYMINNGDTITVLQEVKSSVIPINRNLVEYADGSTSVTISTNYLGNQSVYAGDYGTQNPESVMFYKGRVYFADVRSGKIVRIGGDGIEPISENKIDAYTQDKCFIIASASGVYKVIGGIDPMHNEYLVTYTNVSGGTNIKDTIAYDTEDKVWNTRYSFVPEAYENMDNYMYTFKDGRMHRHTDIANRNEFYAENYDSTIRLVSAFNNSMVKTAEAFSIEGNKPWSFKFQTSGTTAQETVTSSGSSMILKEGAYYLNVPKSISASTTSNRTVIGYVAATGTWASGATITLGNPIVAPFQVSGNTAILCLDASGNTVSTLTSYKKIEQVDRNTIQLSNVSGATPSIATGTILVVDSLASVDGDSIRGPYFLIDVTVNSDLPIEAYAFNVYFSRSKLHNELVTQ